MWKTDHVLIEVQIVFFFQYFCISSAMFLMVKSHVDMAIRAGGGGPKCQKPD